jgi:hypothetical protein
VISQEFAFRNVEGMVKDLLPATAPWFHKKLLLGTLEGMGKDLLPGMAPRFHKKIAFKNLSEGFQGWPLLSGNLEGMTRFVAIAFRKP